MHALLKPACVQSAVPAYSWLRSGTMWEGMPTRAIFFVARSTLLPCMLATAARPERCASGGKSESSGLKTVYVKRPCEQRGTRAGVQVVSE